MWIWPCPVIPQRSRSFQGPAKSSGATVYNPGTRTFRAAAGESRASPRCCHRSASQGASRMNLRLLSSPDRHLTWLLRRALRKVQLFVLANEASPRPRSSASQPKS